MSPSQQAASATPQAITIEQATQVFADWETDYRANPESFYSHAEVAALETATISEARAIHFMSLLRQRINHVCPTCNNAGRYREPYSTVFTPCPDCAARPSSTASATTDASVKPFVSKA